MKIEVTHVRFEGDNESIREVLRSLPQLFGGHAVEQPALADLEPLKPLEPLQALPAPTTPAPAEIQNPVIARKLTQRRTPAPAPPAPTPAKPRVPGGGMAKVVLICREKAGQFNINQAAELAGVKPGSIHGALAYAKTKGNEWACAGEFQFKRAASSESSAKHPDLDGTSMPINPDRIQSLEKKTPAHIAAD